MTSRASKRHRALADNNDSDRISKLPDPIINQILSFLPSATDIMETCLLYRRWENIWASVPSLCFDADYFDDCETFTHFVDSFLILREASVLNKFHLYAKGIMGHLSKPSVSRWIQYAIRNNVKELHIVVTYCAEIVLPHRLFTCQSLEELRLEIGSNQLHRWPLSFVSLLQLKKLHLNDFFIDKDLDLGSSCPLLQDLFFGCCEFVNLDVPSQTLIKLTIDGCSASELRVSCPNLRSLSARATFISTVVLDGLVSLNNALISCCCLDGSSYRGLFNATSLDFTNVMFEFSEIDCLQFQIFYNLKSLTLNQLILCCSTLLNIARLLGYTPNLERLTLDITDLDHCCSPEERTDWDSLELSYFNCPFLESFMVVCNMGLKADIHYPVMLLLKNARSMRKLSFSEYK